MCDGDADADADDDDDDDVDTGHETRIRITCFFKHSWFVATKFLNSLKFITI